MLSICSAIVFWGGVGSYVWLRCRYLKELVQDGSGLQAVLYGLAQLNHGQRVVAAPVSKAYFHSNLLCFLTLKRVPNIVRSSLIRSGLAIPMWSCGALVLRLCWLIASLAPLTH